MKQPFYLMESNEEAIRLDRKINRTSIENLARWAGIEPGMRVADIGCGSGKITSILYDLASPQGQAVGIDGSNIRLDFARKHYDRKGIEFVCRNILDPLEDLGEFDFVWIRFVLEYFRSNSLELLKNIANILTPGGVLVLLDLDHNPLIYSGASERFHRTLQSIVETLEERYNFDPYAGSRLYSYLYDLAYENINVDVLIESLVYGELNEIDYFNWVKKAEVIPKVIHYDFKEYKNGYKEFIKEFEDFMHDRRKFSYTPLVCCRGQKPQL